MRRPLWDMRSKRRHLTCNGVRKYQVMIRCIFQSLCFCDANMVSLSREIARLDDFPTCALAASPRPTWRCIKIATRHSLQRPSWSEHLPEAYELDDDRFLIIWSVLGHSQQSMTGSRLGHALLSAMLDSVRLVPDCDARRQQFVLISPAEFPCDKIWEGLQKSDGLW